PAHGGQPGRQLDDQPPYVDVRARLHPEVDIRVRGEGGEAMLGQLRKSIVACLHFSLATNTSSAPPRDAFSLYSRPSGTRNVSGPLRRWASNVHPIRPKMSFPPLIWTDPTTMPSVGVRRLRSEERRVGKEERELAG